MTTDGNQKHQRSGGSGYAVITTVCNENQALPRLAGCILQQTRQPDEWVIVDDGSSDSTPEVAGRLATRLDWVELVVLPKSEERVRGERVPRALEAGLAALRECPDVVIKIDADVSFDAVHLERLTDAFAQDRTLGIASGCRYEQHRGTWRRQFVTAESVEAQCRAYRASCLEELLPFERRMGWDAIDQYQANAAGWRTQVLGGIGFRHHREIGTREHSKLRAWSASGASAHYIGYRAHYAALRAVYRARRDPTALAFFIGFLGAALRRQGKHPSDDLRARVAGG